MRENRVSQRPSKLRLSPFYPDMHRPCRAQRQMMERIGGDRLTRHQRKVDTLRECREQEMTFEHGKMIADADAGTGSERQVRVTR